MPKIQLSGLITNIKGKAGGSVFARNKGGVYFRANPTPVQQKSVQWNSQKVKFGSISTQWKALTDEEREAWTEMAPNYPSTDAWGNAYTPSGYQLYMKLNGTLFSNGFQPLSVPLAPEELAISDDVNIWYSDNEAFTPTTGANLRGINNRSFYLYQSKFLDSMYLEQFQEMSMRIAINNKTPYFTNPNSYAAVFSLLTLDNTGVFAYISRDSSNNTILTYVLNFVNGFDVATRFVRRYNITNEYNFGSFHVSFKWLLGEQEGIPTIYLNGVEQIPISEENTPDWLDPYNPTQLYVYPSPFIPNTSMNYLNAEARIGDYTIQKSNLFIASDVRLYIDPSPFAPCQCSVDADCQEGFICDGCNCVLEADNEVTFDMVKNRLISRGYLLGNEVIIAALNNFNNGSFPIVTSNPILQPFKLVLNEANGPACVDCVGNDVECQNGKCVYVGDRASALRPLGVTFTPFVIVIPYSTTLPNQYLAVFATKPIGNGKTDFNQPRILLQNSLINGEAFDISDRIAECFKSMQANSKIILYYQVVNGANGQSAAINPATDKKKRKKIRFKAGSELSSAVN